MLILSPINDLPLKSYVTRLDKFLTFESYKKQKGSQTLFLSKFNVGCGAALTESVTGVYMV
jgi:hypothetical protein